MSIFFSVIFLTGHDASGNMPANVNWQAIARASPVIVMYMAVKHLREIASALIAGGRAGEEPVIIVSSATMPSQTVYETTLSGVARFLVRTEPPTPATNTPTSTRAPAKPTSTASAK